MRRLGAHQLLGHAGDVGGVETELLARAAVLVELIGRRHHARRNVDAAFGQRLEEDGSSAYGAIGGGDGTIRVKTRAGAAEVTVVVEDDGCGIPAEIIDRIFDPFFTTKKIGEGTGLGLGIAYRIVRSHDGDLRVESEPGHGARFSVRLPASS